MAGDPPSSDSIPTINVQHPTTPNVPARREPGLSPRASPQVGTSSGKGVVRCELEVKALVVPRLLTDRYLHDEQKAPFCKRPFPVALVISTSADEKLPQQITWSYQSPVDWGLTPAILDPIPKPGLSMAQRLQAFEFGALRCSAWRERRPGPPLRKFSRCLGALISSNTAASGDVPPTFLSERRKLKNQ